MVKFPAEIQKGGGGTYIEFNQEKPVCISDLRNN